MLRHHGGAPAHERGREGLVVGHAEGMGVEDLGLLHLQEIPGVGRGRLRVDGEPVGEQDVFGREGLPVVPADPFSQVKGDDEAVFRDVPGFGQITDDIEIPVVLHEAVEDEPRDAVRGVVRGKHGDEVACIADGALHQDVPVGGHILPLADGDGPLVPVGARAGSSNTISARQATERYRQVSSWKRTLS